MHSTLVHQVATAGVTLGITAVGLVFIVFCRRIGLFMQRVSRQSPLGRLFSLDPTTENPLLALIPPLVFGILITLLGLLLFIGVFTGDTTMSAGT